MTGRGIVRDPVAVGRRFEGDGGAAIVETAMVAPVLLIIFMGIFEYGVLFRDLLGANDAAEAGAKYGSIQGPDLARLTAADGTDLGLVSSDYTILLNTRSGLAGVPPALIDRIVVFKAGPSSRGTPIQQVPAACKTSTTSIAGSCNVYLMPGTFQEIERGNTAYFDPAKVTCPGAPPCGWKAADRNDGPNPSVVEYLGVYVKLRRELLTGMIPVPTTIEAAAVHRLEPGEFE